MLDIKYIRKNPEQVDELLISRGHKKMSKKILEIDRAVNSLKSISSNLAFHLKNRTTASSPTNVGERLTFNTTFDNGTLKEKSALIKSIRREVGDYEDQLRLLLLNTPNLPNAYTPVTETVINNNGILPSFDFRPKSHEELGIDLGLMDFEDAAKMSGSRFVILKGNLSKMERALASFMLDVHSENGFEEHSVPFLVNDKSMIGTGQFPKFKKDSYRTTEGRNLIPTGEVPLTNIVSGKLLPINSLPMRMAANTPCFRSEAGSSGKDTKGMIRLHQFNKVELVTVCEPDESQREFENILHSACIVLDRLKVPYRVVDLARSDIGFSAKGTYDIEAWIPSQETYREVSSITIFGDYQARRMNTRYKHAQKDNRFVHTVNGSGLALGRTLVAIMENYQNEDGSITVPDALISYMGGVEMIGQKETS